MVSSFNAPPLKVALFSGADPVQTSVSIPLWAGAAERGAELCVSNAWRKNLGPQNVAGAFESSETFSGPTCFSVAGCVSELQFNLTVLLSIICF